MAATTIGIDCAVSPRWAGLALGVFEQVLIGETRDSIIRTIRLLPGLRLFAR